MNLAIAAFLVITATVIFAAGTEHDHHTANNEYLGMFSALPEKFSRKPQCKWWAYMCTGPVNFEGPTLTVNQSVAVINAAEFFDLIHLFCIMYVKLVT